MFFLFLQKVPDSDYNVVYNCGVNFASNCFLFASLPTDKFKTGTSKLSLRDAAIYLKFLPSRYVGNWLRYVRQWNKGIVDTFIRHLKLDLESYNLVYAEEKYESIDDVIKDISVCFLKFFIPFFFKNV